MLPTTWTRLTRTIVLLAVFAAGLVAGALGPPLPAWAQGGAQTSNRATLGFVSLRQIVASGTSGHTLPANCTRPVTMVPASRSSGASALEPGVVVLCER